MDDERDGRAETPGRAHGVWFWILGAALAAPLLYSVMPADAGRPSSVTIFGVNGPHVRIVSYPGLRVRSLESRVASAALIH